MRLWIQINSILGFNQFNTITIKWIKLSPKLWMNLTQIRCSGLSMPFWTKIKNSNSLNYAKIGIQLIMYISCVSDGGMKWPDVGFITGSGKWSSRRLPTHRVPHLNFPDCAIGEKNARPKGSPRLRGPERGESLWCHRIAHGFRSNEFRSVGRRCVQKFDERDFF